MTNTKKQEFIHFLKENNAYEKYIHNFNNQKGRITKGCVFLSDSDNITKGKSFVTGAFFWDQTKEGYSFWFDINKKWRSILWINGVY